VKKTNMEIFTRERGPGGDWVVEEKKPSEVRKEGGRKAMMRGQTRVG